MAEEIRQEIQKSAQEADLVLVGIGTEFSKKKCQERRDHGSLPETGGSFKRKNYFY